VRTEKPDWLMKLVLDDADRLLEITVVRDHHGDVEPGGPCVMDQMDGEIDIRALLLAV